MSRAVAAALVLALPPLFYAPSAFAPATAHAAEEPERPAPQPRPQGSPALLFAATEQAWAAGDAASLASLCDSATVRVSLKPGGPPASAPTLGAVSFLIQDQLRLVATRSYRVVRMEVDLKKRSARAWARWGGDWGGRRGVRDVEVVLGARAADDGKWLLTEIRAND